ncbi:phosphoribulokinase [Gallaecimonas sp. GXIMD4217]|uniref:phosphoribulokinase n=1 Tax=Gallaecimonas sp. GXIMD4217 TaxID=3131927 RepID=UPI00311AF608
MSKRHPIIAVTGSSGAGTTTTGTIFQQIFQAEGIKASFLAGDAFHRFTRQEMQAAVRKAKQEGRHISHFGPEANDFARLEACFREYGDQGTGQWRQYLHTFDEAVPHNQMPGTFTPWQAMAADTDLLFYEGLHGGVIDGEVDVSRHVDLLIGMVPIVNLEWIQKISRDTADRGHSKEKVRESIVRSMDDYFEYITPQFSRTHINFQRVPTVDTSNPFSAKAIPSLDESFVVVRFRNMPDMDYPYLLQMIHGSFISRAHTLVVPGGKMGLAMELILRPLIRRLMDERHG